jgi:predicted ATP-dependent endonuclease of OLD family
MSIVTLAISGLRGFASDQTLSLAIPNGKPGSGLTVLVGPNNGGKSTVIEAFKALTSNPYVRCQVWQASVVGGLLSHRGLLIGLRLIESASSSFCSLFFCFQRLLLLHQSYNRQRRVVRFQDD